MKLNIRTFLILLSILNIFTFVFATSAWNSANATLHEITLLNGSVAEANKFCGHCLLPASNRTVQQAREAGND